MSSSAEAIGGPKIRATEWTVLVYNDPKEGAEDGGLVYIRAGGSK